MRYKVTAAELKAKKQDSQPELSKIADNSIQESLPDKIVQIETTQPKKEAHIMPEMIQCKGEIALKFNRMPTPEEIKVKGQISEFEVTDGVITYRIASRTKGVNKANKTIAGFTHPYVIAASAKKITNLNKNLILLEEVGIQVFEKVPKIEGTEANETTPTTD